MSYVIYYRFGGQSNWVKYGRSILDIYKDVVGLGLLAYDLQVLVTDSRGAVTSTTVSFPAATFKPPKPNAPTVGVATSASVEVNWKPLLVPALYQLMYRVSNLDGYVPFGPPTSRTNMVLANLSPRTNYDVIISAINNAGLTLSPVTIVRTLMPSFLDGPRIANITSSGVMASWSRR